MATEIYLGYPPQNVLDWIRNHSQSATRAETRIWWSSDESNYNDYLIEGALDCPALIEKGLMPEGSGTQFEPYWNNLPVKVEIGSAVTSIEDYAFNNCTNLTSMTIPNSVASIKAGAFQCCNSLTSVSIPNSVASIEYGAFTLCWDLTNVTIGSGIQGIGNGAFDTQGSPVTLTIGKTVAEVQAMGTTDYNPDTNVPYSNWSLPSGSTIVCIGGTIPID